VEHLLNLVWLLVASALFALVVREHARGRLRCSLGVALGCTALIALALFPALSMTDDVARAKMYEENSTPHAGNVLLLRLLEDVAQSEALLLPGILLLLLMAVLVVGADKLLHREFVPSLRQRGVQPRGIRPPPASLLFAL